MTGTVLRNLRIFDGHRWLDADSLRLAGGSIQAIGTGLIGNRSDRVMDCSGATALPGLMDAHVHLELDPSRGAPPAADEARDPKAMAARAAAMVRAGITTARDLGGGTWAELRLRDRIVRGDIPGPRLLCAGQPLTRPGGHCHFWGGAVDGLAEAGRHIQRQVDAGVDLLKVMATGGIFTRGSDPGRAQFDLPTLQGIVALAATHGLPVAAHCHGVEGIDFAARAGVRTIEHCSWMGKDGWAANYDASVAQTILARGVWISPTVNAGWQRYLDASDPTKLHNIRAAFQAMQALGIRFVASTDAGIPGVRHHDLGRALDVYRRIVECSPAAALRSATVDAARALGLDRVTGTLAPGLSADVLLVDGDPLADLSVLTDPVAVWAAGRAWRAPP